MKAVYLLLAATAAVSVSAETWALVPKPRHVWQKRGAYHLATNRVERADVRFVRDERQAAEGYFLDVSPTAIVVKASAKAGEFYAMKTLEQLVRKEKVEVEGRGQQWRVEIPCCEIRDSPEFAWRGFLIDEARHFMGKETVKRYIDLMSRVKMNVLHWHLTDDDGWRLELKRHPEVHLKGSVRPESMGHGGDDRDPRMTGTQYGPYFYTQEDVKEILAYAEAHCVKVVPEFDVPAHSRALFVSHPEFTCRGPDDPAFRSPLTMYGPQYECFCAANEDGMRFIEDVFDEICALFPSPEIHIGGDECPPNRWHECPKCQALMRELGLTDERQLQTRMTHRFARFLAARGRKAIAWDETLSKDMPRNLMMQLWRSPADGRRAVEAGLDVILSPSGWCYFDMPQDCDRDPFQYLGSKACAVSLERAFSFDPYEGLAPTLWPRVKGVECCAWGECTWGWFDLNWKMWPRSFATAEVAWTGPRGSLFEDFLARVRPLNEKLVREHVHAAPVTVHPDLQMLGTSPALKPLGLLVGEGASAAERTAFRRAVRPLNSCAVTYGDEIAADRLGEYRAAFLVGGTKVEPAALESYVRAGGTLFVAADRVTDGTVSAMTAGVDFTGKAAKCYESILNEQGYLAFTLFAADGRYDVLFGKACGAEPFLKNARGIPVVWRKAVGKGFVYTVALRRMMPADSAEAGDRAFPFVRYLAGRVMSSCRLAPAPVDAVWCSLGTSITWYDENVSASYGRFRKGYQTRVKEMLRFRDYAAWGCNGGTVSNQWKCLPKTVGDIYTIEHGVNDFGKCVRVGAFEDYLGNASNGTFYANYRILVDNIRAKNPKARFILCTPRKSYGFGTYLPPTCDGEKNGARLADYAVAVRTIAAHERFTVADFFATCGEQDELLSLSIDSALHPNDPGYQLMANELVRAFTACLSRRTHDE